MRSEYPPYQWICAVVLCLGGMFSAGAQNPVDAVRAGNENFTSVASEDPVYLHEIDAHADRYFSKYSGGEKQYARMRHYMLGRLGENGRIVNSTALNYKAYQEYTASQLSRQSFPFAHNGSWDFLGPTSTEQGSSISGMGRVNRFAFHPTDADIVWASTAGGGIWKTEDKGMTWDPLSDGVPVMNTSGVAVDFVDTDILYMLSGDGFGTGSFYGFNEFTRTSVGVFKSIDGGEVWSPTGLEFDETSAVLAYNLYMSPGDRMTLYAATSIGLFRTEDGGASWDTIRNGLIYEVEFKPGTPDRIYCVDNSWFYVSDDGGDTWIDSTQIPAVDGKTGRMTLTTCDGNANLVYLLASPIDTATANDSVPDHRGFYLSLNSGLDFTLIATRPNLLAGSSGTEFKSQAWYDFAMDCNPLNASQVLVATIGMWKTIDAGGTWTSDGAINSLYHADIHEVRTNPLDNTTWVGTDGGIFVSTDFGVTYDFRSDWLEVVQYYDIATSPFFTDYVMAGAQDNGVHLRDDVETLFEREIWGDGMESLFHPTIDSIVISSVQNGEIHMSTDTGHTWTQILPPISGNDSTEWTTPLALQAGSPDVIYVGYKPVMKSVDGGASFQSTSNDTISGHMILETNLSNPSRVYTGDCRSCGGSIRFEMYVSHDAGANWEKLDTNPGFPGNGFFVSDATINPDNSQEIWISVGRYSNGNKVFRSTDAGDSWTNESGSLPNVPVNAVQFQDTNGSPSGAVYAATDIGVFYRDDTLGDWIYFSNNLPLVEVTDLDIDYNGGFLRASTYGRGMWESELYTDCQVVISLNTSNQVLGRSYVHQAVNNLFSTAHVDGYGSRVVYGCENTVLLTEGFQAKAENGAFFKATIKPCTQGGVEKISEPVSKGKSASKK